LSVIVYLFATCCCHMFWITESVTFSSESNDTWLCRVFQKVSWLLMQLFELQIKSFGLLSEIFLLRLLFKLILGKYKFCLVLTSWWSQSVFNNADSYNLTYNFVWFMICTFDFVWNSSSCSQSALGGRYNIKRHHLTKLWTVYLCSDIKVFVSWIIVRVWPNVTSRFLG